MITEPHSLSESRLKIYLRKCKYLSIDEQKELKKQMDKGDLSARDRLIDSVMPRIWQLCSKHPEAEPINLFQECVLRLCERINRWDPDKGPLVIYAYTLVQNVIKNNMSENWLIPVPLKVHQQGGNYPTTINENDNLQPNGDVVDLSSLSVSYQPEIKLHKDECPWEKLSLQKKQRNAINKFLRYGEISFLGNHTDQHYLRSWLRSMHTSKTPRLTRMREQMQEFHQIAKDEFYS